MAATPLPSVRPPAATTPTDLDAKSFSSIRRTSSTSVTTPVPCRYWWPPASMPWQTSTSAPSSTASVAAATFPTWTKTRGRGWRVLKSEMITLCDFSPSPGPKSQTAAGRCFLMIGNEVAEKLPMEE